MRYSTPSNNLGIVCFTKKSNTADSYVTSERQAKAEYRIISHKANVAAFTLHSTLFLIQSLKSRLNENLAPIERTIIEYKRYYERADKLEAIARTIFEKINVAIESDEDRKDYYKIADYGARKLVKIYKSMEDTFFYKFEPFFDTTRARRIAAILSSFRAAANISKELIDVAIATASRKYPNAAYNLHKEEAYEIYKIVNSIQLMTLEETTNIEKVYVIDTPKEVDDIFGILNTIHPSLYEEARNQ